MRQNGRQPKAIAEVDEMIYQLPKTFFMFATYPISG